MRINIDELGVVIPSPTENKDKKDAALKSLFKTKNLAFDVVAERERVRLRDQRIAALPPHIAEERRNAITLDELRLKPVKSARVPDEAYGPFLPWHLLPPSAAPAVTFAVDSPVLFINEAHDDCVNRKEPLGFFCGSPVFELNTLEMEVNQERETINRVATSSGVSVPAEVLPGETICADNIIRRTTTAEHRGEAFYAQLEENIVSGKLVSTEEARQAAQQGAMVTWFNGHAVIHEEATCA